MTTTLFWRALFAWLAMPGVVAFLLPGIWLGVRGILWTPQSPRGFVLLATGAVGLAWCCVDFYRRGKGTLAPWDPPRHLVVSGLYRFSRNPMYACVLMILSGWALAYMNRALVIYAACIATAFHVRIVYGEEPFLDRSYGLQWRRYRASTPRWI